MWRQKGAEISDVVLSSQVLLNQWKSAEDRSFNLAMSLVNEKDGAETWVPPGENGFKMNTDATIFAQSTCFTTARILRDHSGHLIEAQARCKASRLAPEVAEILGIKEALSWIK